MDDLLMLEPLKLVGGLFDLVGLELAEVPALRDQPEQAGKRARVAPHLPD
jgi:hypothetical protein